MNITVFGLWHLGCVTAACCARHFKVIGLDFDRENLERLRQGQAPLLEPGLNERLQETQQSGQLSFSDSPQTACQDADLLWVTFDTPVYDRTALTTDSSVAGPVIVEERETTVFVLPGWDLSVHPDGSLIAKRQT